MALPVVMSLESGVFEELISDSNKPGCQVGRRLGAGLCQLATPSHRRGGLDCLGSGAGAGLRWGAPVPRFANFTAAGTF